MQARMKIQKILSKRLKQPGKKLSELKGYRPSAVLLPLIPKGNSYHLLLTQRTDQVQDHKNQIAFPGGIWEKQDPTLLQTALRESEEEIALPSQQVEILGQLNPVYTPTGYYIAPFVGIIPDALPLKPNPSEIQSLIKVPLTYLQKTKKKKIVTAEFYGPEFDIPYYQYQQHTIWGATGRMVRQLVDFLPLPR